MKSGSGSATDVAGPLRDFRAAPAPPDDEGVAGVPLARLIKRRMRDAPEIVMLSQARSVSAEKFRRLKTVLSNDPQGGPQVIVVTSPAPAEGKTLVSTNLALAFAAERTGNVLLVDADLRRPSVERWLAPPPKHGLAELLGRRIELDHAVLELENSPLRVLPAGSSPRDPVELLASDEMRRLIGELRRRYQRIIVDTPPIVPFTDADVVGALSDGVLLVARAGATHRSLLLRALSGVSSTRILGLVLNDTTFSLADRDSYNVDKQYYRYYERERPK
jgi:capsular exopolysaccharide synthesis family protein